MNCPECGGQTRVMSTRFSYETSNTRQRKCLKCGVTHFTAEIQLSHSDVICNKHYHVKEQTLLKLLQASYS